MVCWKKVLLGVIKAYENKRLEETMRLEIFFPLSGAHFVKDIFLRKWESSWSRLLFSWIMQMIIFLLIHLQLWYVALCHSMHYKHLAISFIPKIWIEFLCFCLVASTSLEQYHHCSLHSIRSFHNSFLHCVWHIQASMFWANNDWNQMHCSNLTEQNIKMIIDKN